MSGRWIVVLAGGVGSRFWPLSTPEKPKQLLPLVSDRPLLVDSVDRLRSIADAEHVLVLTNASLAPAVAAALPHLPPANVIAEPRPSGTAAALAWAAREIERRDGGEAVMISVHADWAIGDPEGFRVALGRAAAAAEQHHALVTIGVVPTRPDPGFGYIERGDEVEPGGGVSRVKRFVEKPDRARAEQMCTSGYLWNSGIFAWRVGDFLEAIRQHCPEVAPALTGQRTITEFFDAVRSISVDHGVLERSDRVLVLPGEFGWDDVGTWGALHRVRAHDESGNAVTGDVHVVDGHDNVVHATSGTVVLYGVDGLVVVALEGMVVVTTAERSADLKQLIERLPARVADAAGGAR